MKRVMENRSWSKPVDDFFSLLKRSFSAKQGRLVKAFASKRITGDMLERTWEIIPLLEVLSLLTSVWWWW